MRNRKTRLEPPALSARITNTRLDVARFGDGRAVRWHTLTHQGMTASGAATPERDARRGVQYLDRQHDCVLTKFGSLREYVLYVFLRIVLMNNQLLILSPSNLV